MIRLRDGTLYNPFESRDLYGIYDTEEGLWTLDCFDDPRLFFSQEAAEEYKRLCKDYQSDRFAVRIFRASN